MIVFMAECTCRGCNKIWQCRPQDIPDRIGWNAAKELRAEGWAQTWVRDRTEWIWLCPECRKERGL